MEAKKLVITGMGAVTPIGIGVQTYWHNLLAGVCGIGTISRFDTSELPVRIAAEVRDFDPNAVMPRSMVRTTDLFMQFAFVACHEALMQSKLAISAESERIGIVLGTALAGVNSLTHAQESFSTSSYHKASPHLIPMYIGNLAASRIAIAYGIHGPSLTLTTACSSGGDAMLTAAMLLRSGEADAIIVVGGEAPICPILVSSLAQAKALSRNNDHPNEASRPFDHHRDGFVLGEGGGAVVLETEEHALTRGAEIFASLAGYATTCDGHHITAPDPEGRGAAACMRQAMAKAGLMPTDIGYVNAHGTSTPLGDKAETLALKKVFGDKTPPISSTKGATGHLMGAGGITELICCIQAIREKILPPTINYHTPDPECDLDYVPNSARAVDIRAAMSNSLGFGGQNSSIIVARYP